MQIFDEVEQSAYLANLVPYAFPPVRIDINLSDDGKYMRTFLHKDADTTVSRLHSSGKNGGVSDQVRIEELEKTVKEAVEKISESIVKPHIHTR